MCGIYGSIGFPPDRARIEIVRYRGPDGMGWREYDAPAGPVALGHRRLAIIDLSDAGLQPMPDASGRHQLVFNGEIYNYREIREELRTKGRVFFTDTDSEVLLAAFIEWGEACLDRLIGMFAFLIWDDREKRLFAARDRFGIKPLYVAATGGGIAFGSEIKQLLRLPGLSGRINLSRLRDYLVVGMTDHVAQTLFDGIAQISPGCSASIDASRPWAGRFEQRRWYAIPSHSVARIAEAEAAERFRALLTDAVRLHLRSDVPVGSCLSGGLDSSSIVCLMSGFLGAEGLGSRLNTVSACYRDKSVDEKPFMDAVVRQTSATPHIVFPRPEDVFERAAQITWHQDEPFGSTSIFAQWCVFGEASRAGIKVMLDGQGADEQLAGYHFCYPYHMADLIRQGAAATLLRTLGERRRIHGTALLDQVRQAAVPFLSAPLRRNLAARHEGKPNHGWLAPELASALRSEPSALEVAASANGLSEVADLASHCVVLTFAANLQMLLHWEDRNSMAHSIEARVPFLDHRLVEFTLGLGGDHKLVGADTKRVLRRAMRGILPPMVSERRDKLGFATPEQSWFRGPLQGLIRDGVEATLRRFASLFNAPGARRLVSEMLDGARPVDFKLWRIVNLGIWGERFGVSP